jgi:hypothetical protein
VWRSADDPRAAIGVSRAALGNAPDRFQKQHILFGEHGISSSELASPLVWRDAGNSSAWHAARVRFQDVFVESEKWLRRSDGMFRCARLHETEITESLIAAVHRRPCAKRQM